MSIFRRRSSRKNIDEIKPVRVKPEYVGFVKKDDNVYYYLLNDIRVPIITKNRNLIPIYTGYDKNGNQYFYLHRKLYNIFNKAYGTQKNTSALRKGIKRGIKVAAAIGITAAFIPEPHVVSFIGTTAGAAGIISGLYKGLSKRKSHINSRENITITKEAQDLFYRNAKISWNHDITAGNKYSLIEPRKSLRTHEGVKYTKVLRELQGKILQPENFFEIENNNISNMKKSAYEIAKGIFGFVDPESKKFEIELNNVIPMNTIYEANEEYPRENIV
jgi:hypothetical protein